MIDLNKRANYIRDVFAKTDPVLDAIEARIHSDTDPIYLRAEDAKILEFLIKFGDIKSIVEIGTLAGYSTTWMARAIPEEGHIYTMERDPERANMARQSFKDADIEHKVTLCEGMALERLKTIENKGPFDMVFIDADKHNYLNYLYWAIDHVADGGLIVGDNTFLFESVYLGIDEASKQLTNKLRPTTCKQMQEFNKIIADHPAFTTIMLSTKEGMTVACKRV